MKNRIFVKLFAAALLIIAICALTMNVLIHRRWNDMLRSEIETSLRQKTLLFASRIENTPPDAIGKVTTGEVAIGRRFFIRMRNRSESRRRRLQM